MKKFTMVSTAVALAFTAAPFALRAEDEPENPPPPPPMEMPMGGGMMEGGMMGGGMMKMSFPDEQKGVEEALKNYRENATDENKSALKTAVSKLMEARSKAMVEHAEKQLAKAKEMAEKKDEMTDKMVERMLKMPPRRMEGAGMMGPMGNVLTKEEQQQLRTLRNSLRDKDTAKADKLKQIEAMKALYQGALDRRIAETEKARAEGKDTAELERGNTMLKNMISRMADPEKFLENMNRRPNRGEGGRGPGNRR